MHVHVYQNFNVLTALTSQLKLIPEKTNLVLLRKEYNQKAQILVFYRDEK